MTGKPRFEQFFAMRRLNALSNIAFSPDGGRIAYSTDASGQFNLWTQPAAGGWPTQLTTFEDEAVRWITWLPNGDILFFADRQGDEKYQLYRISRRGGWPRRITERDDVQFIPGWPSPDGRTYAFGGNERKPTDVDVLLYDVETGERRIALQGDGWFNAGRWAPDGRSLAVTQVLSNTDQHVHLLDPRSGEHHDLTPHDGEERNHAIAFRSDGAGLHLITDRGGEHPWLGTIPLDGREPQPIWRGDWEVELATASRDGRRLAWSVNEDGYSAVHVRDEGRDRDLALPPVPRGVVQDLALSPDGRRLALKITTGALVPDIHVIDLERRTIAQVTFSFLGGVPVEDMVEPELVRIATDDGKRIPAWTYRPRGASGKVPAVMVIHGGPEAQERPIFQPLYQFLLSRGVGILAPNIRGSSGYGREWQVAIHRDWMGVDLRDLRSCAEHLRSLDWVDPERLGVAGGSYGGFATLLCATRLPEYWAAAVDIVGPSNLVTFAKAVPPTWKRIMAAWVGDPETEEAFLMARSPITYVDRMRAPILVIQGAKDPRVVKAESDQMVERLRARQHPVEYLVFEDEGHGFTKRANQQKGWRAAADFLLRRFGLGGSDG
ncbi:MAG TPA: S9 family peptidase [Candidatus Limnocylindrales bacterium]|nr:S9 family peptidase [Candidatus Limnocylindrales bacterium]